MGDMTTAQALAVVWLITMAVLGIALDRGNRWKRAHDRDHAIMTALMFLNATFVPTRASIEAAKAINDDEATPMTIDVSDLERTVRMMEKIGMDALAAGKVPDEGQQ